MCKRILVATLFAALTACGRPSSEAGHGIVQDSAGVRIVRLQGTGASAPAVELSLDGTWKSQAGSEGELVDVQAFSDGRLAVLDHLSAAVSVLSADGAFQAWIGRPGEGPGELSPRGLRQVLVTDSSVLVPDLFQQRISEFLVSGELVSVRPFPGGGGYAVDWQWGQGGSLAYRLLQADGDLLLQAFSTSVDTLHAFPENEGQPNVLLPTVSLWALSERYLAVAESDTWAVDLFEIPSHRQVLGVRRDVDPPGFTTSDRTSLIGVLVASESREAGGRELSAAERDALLGMVAFPEVRPLLASLLLAPNGDIWVNSAKPVAEMGREALLVGSAKGYGGPDWDIFDNAGSLRTRVSLPDGFAPRDFMNNFLYGVVPDELGVPRVARVVIPWAQ